MASELWSCLRIYSSRHSSCVCHKLLTESKKEVVANGQIDRISLRARNNFPWLFVWPKNSISQTAIKEIAQPFWSNLRIFSCSPLAKVFRCVHASLFIWGSDRPSVRRTENRRDVTVSYNSHMKKSNINSLSSVIMNHKFSGSIFVFSRVHATQ